MHTYLRYMHWKKMNQNNTCDYFWVVILRMIFIFSLSLLCKFSVNQFH